MKARFRLFKARMVQSFGIALMIAGAVPVLYAAALLGWQFSVLSTTGSWMPLPATLPFVELRAVILAAALCLFALGAIVARRQKAVILLEKRRREDRLRRLHDYRRDTSRIDSPEDRREPSMSTSEAKAELELERAVMNAASEAARERYGASATNVRAVRAL